MQTHLLKRTGKLNGLGVNRCQTLENYVLGECLLVWGGGAAVLKAAVAAAVTLYAVGAVWTASSAVVAVKAWTLWTVVTVETWTVVAVAVESRAVIAVAVEARTASTVVTVKAWTATAVIARSPVTATVIATLRTSTTVIAVTVESWARTTVVAVEAWAAAAVIAVERGAATAVVATLWTSAAVFAWGVLLGLKEGLTLFRSAAAAVLARLEARLGCVTVTMRCTGLAVTGFTSFWT